MHPLLSSDHAMCNDITAVARQSSQAAMEELLDVVFSVPFVPSLNKEEYLRLREYLSGVGWRVSR
jgi:hypothetical protein